jgi:signal transduction histidine kinase
LTHLHGAHDIAVVDVRARNESLGAVKSRNAEVSEDRNYRFESTDVAAVAENVVEYLSRLAERRTIYRDLFRSSTASESVQADPSELHMLLKNVIENAIEHSPTGGVVAVPIESDRVTIRDEGPGIPDADLPHLFTRFWRGSARQAEGTGLGLAICKEIVTAHHWNLSARNSGHGAEFVLSFHDTQGRDGFHGLAVKFGRRAGRVPHLSKRLETGMCGRLSIECDSFGTSRLGS